MRTTRLVRRFAAAAVMVASAALPAGVAHSVDAGTAPVTATQSTPQADWVTSQKQTVVNDPGLPGKGASSPVIPVQKTPSVDTLTRDPAAPVSATPVTATTTQTTKSTTTKTTTTKVTSKSVANTAANTTNKTSTVSTPQAPAAVAPPATSGSVTARQDLASAVASATNAQRVAAGLSPLSYRSCSVPASFAVKLATEGALYHNSLTTVLSACGGTTTAGENIARGYTSVSAVTAGWMASAGHKANILNPSFKSISVGVAQASNGTYYWVENFVG
jgi:uncharacterized protein YkwD